MMVFVPKRRFDRVKALFVKGAISNVQAVDYLLFITMGDRILAEYYFTEFICN